MKARPAVIPSESGPRYWRSLEQLADSPEFREWAEREFPEGTCELADPVSRRHFVKITLVVHEHNRDDLIAVVGVQGSFDFIESFIQICHVAPLPG